MSDSVTLWTVACQPPLSMGFFRQEYWSGLPFPSPGDLPDPGIEPRSPTLQVDVLPSEPPGKPVYTIDPSFPKGNWSPDHGFGLIHTTCSSTGLVREAKFPVRLKNFIH